MQSYEYNVIDRPDTLLGVCQAIGEDFGISPTLLRVCFALPLFWDPIVVIVVYLAAGLLVALSRLVAPNPRFAAPEAGGQPMPEAAAAEATPEPEPMRQAA